MIGSDTQPIAVAWLLGDDRPKADTLSLARWVRGLAAMRPASPPTTPDPSSVARLDTAAGDALPLRLRAVFLSPPSGQAGPAGEFAPGQTIPAALAEAGATVVHRPDWRRPTARAARSLADWLAAQQIAVMQTAFLRADLLAARAARRGTLRAAWLVRASGAGRFRRTRLYGGDWLDRCVYLRADGFVAVSTAVRDDWAARLRRPVSDFAVIHNPAPPAPRLADHLPAPAQIRQRYGLSPNDKLLLAVARLDREKGVETLIDAMAKLRRPDAKVVVLGEGPWRRRLQRRIDRAKLAGQVVLAGQSDLVWPHLASADAVVLASRMEGCPNALLEAAAAGRTIVATAVGGVPELVRHEREALLVEPAGGPAALAAAIARVLDEPDLAARLGEAARRRVQAERSPRRAAEQFVQLYRQFAVRR